MMLTKSRACICLSHVFPIIIHLPLWTSLKDESVLFMYVYSTSYIVIFKEKIIYGARD